MKDYLAALFVSTLAVFAPIKATLITMMILVVVDLITGILAARKRGEKITSAAIRRTSSKFLLFNTAVMLGFLVETYLLDGFVPVSKIAAGLIGLHESKSVFENLDTINGSPIFKSLISKLGSVNDLPKDIVVKEEPKIEEKASNEGD